MPLPKLRSSSLAGNSFFIFIIRFFPQLASLLVMIWFSRHLPTAAYGDYQHFWIQIPVFYPLACFGIHVLLLTYSPDFIVQLAGKIKAVQYALYLAWVGLLAGVFAYLQHIQPGLPLAIPFLFLIGFSLSFILESVLIVFRRYKMLVTVNVLYATAFCAAHLYVLNKGFSIQVLFTWLLVITLARFMIYGLMVFGSMRNHIAGQESSIEISRIKSLWFHLGVFDVIQLLSGYIDKFIISVFLTAELSAYYFNGSQTIPFLPLLLSAAGSAVLIHVALGKGDKEHANLVRLMNQTGRILSCIVFPVFCYLLFFRTEFIVTVFSIKYLPAVPVFFASLLVLPVRAYSFTTVLQRLHKGHIINIGAVGELLLAIMLIYPLYQLIGLPGVALAFVITTYLQAGFYLYHSASALQTSILNLIPVVNWVAKLLVFSVVFFILHYVCDLYFSWKISLILGGVMMAIVAVVALLIEFNKQGEDGITE